MEDGYFAEILWLQGEIPPALSPPPHLLMLAIIYSIFSCLNLSRHWRELRSCVAASVRDRCPASTAEELLRSLQITPFKKLSYAELLALGLLVQNKQQMLRLVATAEAASNPLSRVPSPPSRPVDNNGRGAIVPRTTERDSPKVASAIPFVLLQFGIRI